MRRHSYAGARESQHLGYMVGLAQRRNINAPAGFPTGISLRRGSTSGTLPPGRFIPLRPRRLCNWLCHCGRLISSEIISFTSGSRLLPPRVVSVRTAFSPRVLILGLLLGLAQSGNAGGATLNTCPGISGLGRFLAVTLLRDDLFRPCSGSDSAAAVLLVAFASECTPVLVTTTCHVPFLHDPAAALGRHPPWRMALQCLAIVAVFLLGVSSAARAHLQPSTSTLASLYLPAWSSANSW